MADYDKNAKPFSKRGFRQGDNDNPPQMADQSYEKDKAPFGKKVNLTNSVTNSSSAKIQKISKLSGRASVKPGSAHKKLV